MEETEAIKSRQWHGSVRWCLSGPYAMVAYRTDAVEKDGREGQRAESNSGTYKGLACNAEVSLVLFATFRYSGAAWSEVYVPSIERVRG